MTQESLFFKKLTEEDYVSDFACGPEPWQKDVSDFLVEDALTQQGLGLNVTWLCSSGTDFKGYVSLSAGSIRIEHGSKWRSLLRLDPIPYKEVPCILIGRLAVHENAQRQGIGKFMLSWVRGLASSQDIGAKLLVLQVENRNKTARVFWKSQGFTNFEPQSGSKNTFMVYDLCQ